MGNLNHHCGLNINNRIDSSAINWKQYPRGLVKWFSTISLEFSGISKSWLNIEWSIKCCLAWLYNSLQWITFSKAGNQSIVVGSNDGTIVACTPHNTLWKCRLVEVLKENERVSRNLLNITILSLFIIRCRCSDFTSRCNRSRAVRYILMDPRRSFKWHKFTAF